MSEIGMFLIGVGVGMASMIILIATGAAEWLFEHAILPVMARFDQWLMRTADKLEDMLPPEIQSDRPHHVHFTEIFKFIRDLGSPEVLVLSNWAYTLCRLKLKVDAEGRVLDPVRGLSTQLRTTPPPTAAALARPLVVDVSSEVQWPNG